MKACESDSPITGLQNNGLQQTKVARCAPCLRLMGAVIEGGLYS